MSLHGASPWHPIRSIDTFGELGKLFRERCYRDGKPDIQQGWVEGVDVDGNTLYAALGPAGMATFDISEPARPAHLATIAPGTWGNEVVFRDLLLVSGRGAGVGVWRVGRTPAELTKAQTLPCYFYNSKFWVEGDRVFTNSEESTNYFL